jgi:Zn-finger nucleic acid-binding protein
MCLGLWAPGDVMDRLVERARERHEQEGPPAAEPAHRERRSTWQEQVSYRRCPECGGTMQRRNFGHRSGVIVDWCGSHGTWLDPHEMEDIAAFVLEGGLETALAKGGDRNWRLPADPGRTAAILAAEKLLAEERARSLARRHGGDSAAGRALRGLGDFLATLLK